MRLKNYYKLRDIIKQKWNRDLPYDELCFDRWERANALGFGKGTSVYHNCYIYGDVTVGENTWIGAMTVLDGSGGLEIGSNCSISMGVHIYSHNTVKWAVSNGIEKYEHKPTKIGNCCFIAPNVIIQNGVTIGNNSIIGAGSYVNKDIPPFSIAVGSPAKVIGKVVLNENGTVELKYTKE